MVSQNNLMAGSSLMAVIIITVVSITVIGAITILTSLILYSMMGWQDSLNAQIVAESLTDDITLRLIRDPQMTPIPNEEMTINGAVASVSHTPPQITGQPSSLSIRGVSGNYVHNIKIQYVIEEGGLHILSRQETN